MIAFITGVLGDTFGHACIVHTSGGVGYLVRLPAHTFAALPSPGSPVSFHISMAVREDALELYGFETFAERQAYAALRQISKVGPRTALAILSMYRPEELEQIVRDENLRALTKVSGIGQRTAQQILLELRFKLAPRGKSAQSAADAGAMPSAQADVMAALASLGYEAEEALPKVRQIFADEPDMDVAGGVRMALRELAKGKA